MPRPRTTSTRTYLVEHYWPGATAAVFEEAMARVAWSAHEMAAGGARIQFLHSTFIPGDEAALAVLVADTDARVKEAYRAAGVSFDRVMEAVDTDVASGQPMTRGQKPSRRW